jgi:hypothetical protein
VLTVLKRGLEVQILRKFHFRNGKTKELNEDVADFLNCGKYPVFEGTLFEWQFYDKIKSPILLVYSEVREELWDAYTTDEIISLLPPKIDCECGAQKSRTTHAFWCPMHHLKLS